MDGGGDIVGVSTAFNTPMSETSRGSHFTTAVFLAVKHRETLGNIFIYHRSEQLALLSI